MMDHQKDLVPLERNSKQKVLEEDDYLDRMAKIIKRDFFLDALVSEKLSTDRDFEQSERSYCSTPGTSRTDLTSTTSVKSRNDSCALRLDQFLDRYTSEDNAYFEKLQRKDFKKHRAKYPWLYLDSDNRHNKKVQDQLKLPISNAQIKAIESSAASRELVDWPYRTRNTLFYPAITDGARKKTYSTVNYESTKYMQDPIFKEPYPVAMSDRSKISHEFPGKIGIDGNMSSDAATPSINGYSFIPPPESPKLPKQSQEDNTIKIKSEPRNKYYIPSESPRDNLARRLYDEKVAKKIRTPRSSTRSVSSRGTPDTKESFSKWRL